MKSAVQTADRKVKIFAAPYQPVLSVKSQFSSFPSAGDYAVFPKQLRMFSHYRYYYVERPYSCMIRPRANAEQRVRIRGDGGRVQYESIATRCVEDEIGIVQK